MTIGLFHLIELLERQRKAALEELEQLDLGRLRAERRLAAIDERLSLLVVRARVDRRDAAELRRADAEGRGQR